MTTRIGNPHTRHNRPRTSPNKRGCGALEITPSGGVVAQGLATQRTLPLHGHHHAAPGPQIGTLFQLESSYASRNNRNRISYEKTFSSYDHVPMLSYGFPCRNPGHSAFSSPKPLPSSYKLPTKLALPFPLNRNRIPKLSQSCHRNSPGTASASPSLDPSQPDTSPEPSPDPPPSKLEHGPKLSQSCGRNNSRTDRASNHPGPTPSPCRRRSRSPSRHSSPVDDLRPGPLDSPALRITDTRDVVRDPLFGGSWAWQRSNWSLTLGPAPCAYSQTLPTAPMRHIAADFPPTVQSWVSQETRPTRRTSDTKKRSSHTATAAPPIVG